MKLLVPLALAAFFLGSCASKPETPKISIFCDHIWTVARQENISFAEAAARIREIGYTGADVRVLQKPEELNTLDSLGFAHSCAIADIDFSTGDQPEMEDIALNFMKMHGYERLLLVPGLMAPDATVADREAARRRIVAFAEKAAAQDVQVLLEDYDNPRSLCFNIERLDSLFALSDDIGHVFDTGNYLFAGDDALEAYKLFSDRIGHVHLKDRTAPDDLRCVPAGSGCIPMAEIVNDLLATGYDGWLTVEQYGSRQMLSDSRASYANVLQMLE